MVQLSDLNLKAKQLLGEKPVAKQLQALVKSLRDMAEKVATHIRKQLLYQSELKFIQQSDQKMKTAERDINRAVYAFNLVRESGGFEAL